MQYDSDGMALQYMLSGARAVLGTLWDVTDGDLDKLTLTILKVGHPVGSMSVWQFLPIVSVAPVHNCPASHHDQDALFSQSIACFPLLFLVAFLFSFSSVS